MKMPGALLAIGVGLVACAQTSPRLDSNVGVTFPGFRASRTQVQVVMPPTVALGTKRIAIVQVGGDHSASVVADLTKDLTAAGMTVISAKEVRAVLGNLLPDSGPLSPAVYAALREQLPATAFLDLQMQRVALTPQYQTTEPTIDCTYRAGDACLRKGLAEILVSVAAAFTLTDASGHRFPKTFKAESRDRKYSWVANGFANGPIYDSTLAGALHSVTNGIHAMVIGSSAWYPLFSGSVCGINTARELLAAGNVTGALTESSAGIQRCNTDSKVTTETLAHALFNRSVMHLVNGDTDSAFMSLDSAQVLHALPEAPGLRVRISSWQGASTQR